MEYFNLIYFDKFNLLFILLIILILEITILINFNYLNSNY